MGLVIWFLDIPIRMKNTNIPNGKRFKIEYFHTYTDQQFFKVVRAKDKQEAVAKFQEAVRWDFDRIGRIEEVKQ